MRSGASGAFSFIRLVTAALLCTVPAYCTTNENKDDHEANNAHVRKVKAKEIVLGEIEDARLQAHVQRTKQGHVTEPTKEIQTPARQDHH